MEPWSFTLHELNIMAMGKLMDAWDHTSLIWSTMCNVNRDPKKRSKPFHPNEIHPFAEYKPKEKPRPISEAVKMYARPE